MKLLLTLSASVALSGACFAQDISTTASTFCKQTSSALSQKNFVAYQSALKWYTSPDFRYIEYAVKPMPVAEVVAFFKKDFSHVKPGCTAKDEVFRVKDKGLSAMVVVRHNYSGTIVDRAKASHSFSISGTSQDVWKKVGNTWRLATTSWLSHVYKIDGKTVDRAHF